MTKAEYFNYAMKKQFPYKRKWIYRTFMIVLDDKQNEFLTFKDKKPYVNVNGEDVLITDGKYDEPLFTPNDKVTLNIGSFIGLTKPFETTYGIAIVNKCLIEFGLSGKIPYINGEVNMKNIEASIKNRLKDEVPDEDKDANTIYPSDIETLSQADMLVQDWATIFTVSKTRKSMLPPTGLKEYKAKLLKEMKAKYGDNLFKEDFHAVEYDDKLKAFDREYLKDDPSYGIVMSNKIIGVSRKKRNLSFGLEKNAFNPDAKPKMIFKTLTDGLDLSPDTFPYYVNSSRAGSLFRGVETQQSGTIAKNLVMATIGLSYQPGDCGVKRYKELKNVSRGERYIGRYILEGDKLVEVTSAEQINGKDIKMRTPMECLYKTSTFCSVCAGSIASQNPTAIILQSTKVGGDLVNGDMKKMHGTETHATLIEF